MNEYYISRYAYFFVSSKGECLGYCSRSNTFLKLECDLYAYLLEIQKAKSRFEWRNENTLELFKKYKFLVKEGEDDDFLLKHQFEQDTATYHPTSLGLIIVPTLSCNFDCQYCFEQGKRAIHMEDDTIQQLIPFIKKHRYAQDLHITWYGGEPLLRIDAIRKVLLKISSELPDYPIKYHSIITNGYYFNQEVIDLFKEFPLNAIQITLDGKKKRHDSIRKLKKTGQGSYDRIISNIDNILKELPKTEVRVRVNIEKSNWQDFDELYHELTHRWNNKNLSVYPGFLRIDDETGRALSCDAIDRWQALRMNFEWAKKGMVNTPIYPKRTTSIGCCATVINSYIIGPKGEIYKCWNDVSDDKRIIAYINEDKFVNSKLFYRYVVGSKWYHNPECVKCFFLPICQGTCAYYRLRNRYEDGKYDLCQCLHRGPNLLNECLEYWYDTRLSK